MKEYLLGIDLGTSGTKTVLFTLEGVPVASETIEYPLYQPHNGWAEQNPEDWWNAACQSAKAVIEKAEIESEQIRGIGISGQMHGLVLLDEEGKVLRKSLLWCDGRTSEECREMTEMIGAQKIIDITANPVLTGFTAPKILWVRKHEPELFAKVRHILLPKDYVRFRLTGNLACDYSDASGTSLLDIRNRCWSKDILQSIDLQEELLPPLKESTDIAGSVTEQAAEASGLAAGTAVVMGGGDNACAAVGTGVVEEGKAFTTLGTSGVVYAHTNEAHIDPQGRVHTFCAAVPGSYTVMSCTLSAGLSLRWIRDVLCDQEKEEAQRQGVDPYDIMTREAQETPVGADRLLFLPYLMGERSPLLDEKARGGFIGLSAIHGKGHMIRSVLEGVAYSQRQCLDILREMKVAPDTMMICGGGGNSPFWRQMLADIYQIPVRTVINKEGPALGAAILAGVGTGVWESVPDACAKLLQYRPFEMPDAQKGEQYEPFYQIYKTLYPSLKDAYHALAKQS